MKTPIHSIKTRIMWVLLVLITATESFATDSLTVQERIQQLDTRFQTDLNGWRAHVGDPDGAEHPEFDDSTWAMVDTGFEWETPNSICWFRRWIEVPEQLDGVPVEGAQLTLRMNVDNGGAIYVDGELKQPNFDWADGKVVLSESAKP